MNNDEYNGTFSVVLTMFLVAIVHERSYSKVFVRDAI